MKHLKRLGAGLLLFGVLAAAGTCCFSLAILWQSAIETHSLVRYITGTAGLILGAYGMGYVFDQAGYVGMNHNGKHPGDATNTIPPGHCRFG